MLSGTCENGGIWDLSSFCGSLSLGDRESCDRRRGMWSEGADGFGFSQGNTGVTLGWFCLDWGQALASEGDGVSKHDLL